MPSGSLTLATRWDSTQILTGNPEITFFKAVYKRHTQFAVESINVEFNETLDFGVETECSIDPMGDLISNIYLKMTLPHIVATETNAVSDEIYQAKILSTKMYDDFKLYLNDVMEHYNHYTNALLINNNTFENMYNNNISNQYSELFNEFANSRNDFYTHIETHEFNLTAETLKRFGTKSDWEGDSLNNTKLPNIIEAINATPNITNDELTDLLITALSKFKNAIDYHYSKIHQIKIFYTNMYNHHVKKKFAWAKNIGYSAIDMISITIGGTVIQTFTSDKLQILNELYETDTENLSEMIGNVPSLTTPSNDIPQYNLYVPLPFWFTKDTRLALPISIMQFSQVSITVKLKSLNDCCYSELSSIPHIVDACLIVDYCYLGNKERERFAQTTIDYIVPIIEMEERILDDNNMELLFYIDNKIIKEFIWYIADKDVEKELKHVTFQPLRSHGNKWETHPLLLSSDMITIFNTHYKPHNIPLKSVSILLKGVEDIATRDAIVFDSIVPFQHHPRTPKTGLYTYCYALYPSSIQPSGHCDFTNIESIDFKLQFNLSTLTDSMVLRFYTVEHRIVRVMNGRAYFI